jgi:methylenetetrahydrofolate dehydrogenase (NADP+)/methenyltetrahydrofolate cyclohydrolase
VDLELTAAEHTAASAHKERPLPATILDGKKLATEIEAELAVQVADFVENNGHEPCLAAVLVGDDPASGVYVKNKRLACERVGMESQLHRLSAATSEDELLKLIARFNNDEQVNGILVQLPLPRQIREQKVLDAVHPLKDVDCFHPENVGLMVQGRPRYLPCTPHGCVQILHRYGLKAAGQHVVVVGRSEIVGKPVATMLAQKESHLGSDACNATVTICHSRTTNLPEVCRQADILIAAIGKPRFVQGDWIKPGAVVIDVGINRTESGLCGDVDFETAKEVASAITPVPRGVGPMTITMLLLNTMTAARAQLA